jgi:hypothetical protein
VFRIAVFEEEQLHKGEKKIHWKQELRVLTEEDCGKKEVYCKQHKVLE